MTAMMYMNMNNPKVRKRFYFKSRRSYIVLALVIIILFLVGLALEKKEEAYDLLNSKPGTTKSSSRMGSSRHDRYRSEYHRGTKDYYDDEYEPFVPDIVGDDDDDRDFKDYDYEEPYVPVNKQKVVVPLEKPKTDENPDLHDDDDPYSAPHPNEEQVVFEETRPPIEDKTPRLPPNLRFPQTNKTLKAKNPACVDDYEAHDDDNETMAEDCENDVYVDEQESEAAATNLTTSSLNTSTTSSQAVPVAIPKTHGKTSPLKSGTSKKTHRLSTSGNKKTSTSTLPITKTKISDIVPPASQVNESVTELTDAQSEVEEEIEEEENTVPNIEQDKLPTLMPTTAQHANLAHGASQKHVPKKAGVSSNDAVHATIPVSKKKNLPTAKTAGLLDSSINNAEKNIGTLPSSFSTVHLPKVESHGETSLKEPSAGSSFETDTTADAIAEEDYEQQQEEDIPLDFEDEQQQGDEQEDEDLDFLDQVDENDSLPVGAPTSNSFQKHTSSNVPKSSKLGTAKATKTQKNPNGL